MPILVDGELVLYGFVGESFWGEGFTAREVLDALSEHGRDNPLTVRINSGGGYVDDGIAIFNALKAHAGKVTVIVDSVALSSASLIAMAGEERLMRTGSMMMIHDPASSVWGTAADFEAFAKVMDKHGANMASIYAEVAGGTPEDIREDMKAELWMTADEAVKRGFATGLQKSRSEPVAAHDYSIYAKAPQRFVALSERQNWSCAKASITGEKKAPSPVHKESPIMTEKTTAEQAAADTQKLVSDAVSKALADQKARIKAILASEEAKGREALAEHFAHDTEMTAEAAIAAMKAAPKIEASSTTPAPGAAQNAAYEAQRLAAAGLAQPGGKPAAAKSGLTRLVDAHVGKAD